MQSTTNTTEIIAKFENIKLSFDSRIEGEPPTIIAQARRDYPKHNSNDKTMLLDDNYDYHGSITIKGPAEESELRHDLEYRFLGKWTQYKNKRTGQTEQQFQFTSFTLIKPHNREGIIKYLQTAPNLGLSLARKLWEEFGPEAVEVVRTSPEKIAAILNGLTIPKAQEAAEYLTEQMALESCSIDLIDLLTGRGFPKSIQRKVVKVWGLRGAELIRKNPYLLMAFRGCGFKRCDQMYLQLGLDPGRLKRQALSAWYAISSNTEGHTWYPKKNAVAGIYGTISGADVKESKALSLCYRAKMLDHRETDSTSKDSNSNDGSYLKIEWVAEHKKAKAERQVAEFVADSTMEPECWTELADDPTFMPRENECHQREQVLKSLKSVIGILGGSPGTGKTYTAAAAIVALTKKYGIDQIAVAAPTGKAAVRVTESLQYYGLDLRARTIHSLLGVGVVTQQAKDKAESLKNTINDEGGMMFAHDQRNPLPFKFIVVDESSMIDTSLMRSLLAARAKGTHILFVGDTNQLPPVGHGAPLRDMIAAGIAYGELREIRRNSGLIVEVCAAIRDRKRWNDCAEIDIAQGNNLKVIGASNEQDQINQMLWAVRTAKQQKFDPIWDCQIIVPVNAKSRLSRKELNKILQLELNQNPAVERSPFRTGDKVVNTKNGWIPRHEGYYNGIEQDEANEDVPTNDNGEVYVANGELGEVIEATEKMTIIRLSNPKRIVRVGRSSDNGNGTGNGSGSDEPNDDDKTNTGCNWDLGYALSCHKSQGSEWPIAIVMLDEYPGAKRVCSREWLYTAISRAKKLCLLIGKQSTAEGYCKRSALAERKTFLKELILEEIESRKVKQAAAEVDVEIEFMTASLDELQTKYHEEWERLLEERPHDHTEHHNEWTEIV